MKDKDVKCVEICGISYEVKFLEPNNREDDFMGRQDPQRAVITINKTVSKEVQQQTLIHEWIHAVLCNHCLDDRNEPLVQTLACELHRNGFKLPLLEKQGKKIDFKKLYIEEQQKKIKKLEGELIRAEATKKNEI